MFFSRTYVILEIARKNRTFQCCVVELLYLHFFSEPDASHTICLWCWVPLYVSNNLHSRSKQHKISLAWLRIFFTLFTFICTCSYITNQPHWMTQTSLIRNFATSQWKSAWNSWLHFEGHNLIDNYVIKFPSSYQTLRISNELWKQFVNSFVKCTVTFVNTWLKVITYLWNHNYTAQDCCLINSNNWFCWKHPYKGLMFIIGSKTSARWVWSKGKVCIWLPSFLQ